MRLLAIITISILVFSLKAQSQYIESNFCDSSILTKEEYEKCIGDTIFNNDVLARINYISFLKTELLPKFRIERKTFTFSDAVNRDARILKSIYDSTLNFKLQHNSSNADRHQKYLQPKAYITTLLAMETFKFYPDIYAILLNNIHLILNPKTDYNQMLHVQKLHDKIYASLPTPLINKIQHITSVMKSERASFTKDYPFDMFQGAVDEEKRKQYDVINFILWTM